MNQVYVAFVVPVCQKKRWPVNSPKSCSEALDKATLQGLQAAQEAALAAASKSASKANKQRQFDPEKCEQILGDKNDYQAAEKDAKEAAFQEALATWMGVGFRLSESIFWHDGWMAQLLWCQMHEAKYRKEAKAYPPIMYHFLLFFGSWVVSVSSWKCNHEGMFPYHNSEEMQDAPRVATGIER